MNYLTGIATLAALGMFDAGYLLYTRLAGVSINCGPVFHGCDTVAASSYSVFLGLPLSFWGLLFYIGILKIAFHMQFSLLEKFGLGFLRAYLPQMLLICATLGLVSSAYFTYLQAFVINAWCTYCIISACISVCIFILTVMHTKKISSSK